jgi:hypothetical protein
VKPIFGSRVSTSIERPTRVLMSERTSAPPSTAALAAVTMSVTFGESFTTSGRRVAGRTAATSAWRAAGSFPKTIPPFTTFGQETFSSTAATRGSSPIRSTTARYSASVSPQTFARTVAPFSCSFGSFSERNSSMPTFWRPIALSIPASVSQIRGGGFPRQGRAERPFTEIAPREPRSTNPSNSSPYPNVPDAVAMGFFSWRRPRWTERSTVIGRLPGGGCGGIENPPR